MKNLYCKSIAPLVLLSITILDLNAATFAPSKFSSNIVVERKLSNDTIHKVGELFGGGVIYYVDRTGHHGLICSMSDIRDPKSLYLFPKQDPERLKGRKDSATLINQVLSVSKYEQADELCNNYTNSNYGTGVFKDWHLPTIDQLDILFKVRNIVNIALEGFNKTIIDPLDKMYWSSSKNYDDRIAVSNWMFDFKEGARGFSTLPDVFVRAIRDF